MNIIRNGGFERGDTSFWELIEGSSLTAVVVAPYTGLYCGRLVSDGSANCIVRNNDYVAVEPDQIINLGGRYKNTVLRNVQLCIKEYDADYTYLGDTVILSTNIGINWTLFEDQYVITGDVRYIQFEVRLVGSADGDILYLDSNYVRVIPLDIYRLGVKNIALITGIVGATDVIVPYVNCLGYQSAIAELTCAVLTGAGRTLDVEVWEYTRYGRYLKIGTFVQMGNVGAQRIELPLYTGYYMFIHYITNASVTDGEFAVDMLMR